MELARPDARIRVLDIDVEVFVLHQRPTRNLRAALSDHRGAVVDKDGIGRRLDVEIVVIDDGEIPHPASSVGGRIPTEYCQPGARGGLQAGAGAESCRLPPSLGGRIPEQVSACGVNDRRAACSLDDQVVAVGVVT